jgi:hypothetical protein
VGSNPTYRTKGKFMAFKWPPPTNEEAADLLMKYVNNPDLRGAARMGASALRKVEKIKQLERLQEDVAEFWSKILGKKGTPKYCIAKLLEEVRELEKSPKSLEEGADCLLVLLFWLESNRFSLDDLIQEALRKHQENKERQWQVKENGILQHKE